MLSIRIKKINLVFLAFLLVFTVQIFIPNNGYGNSLEKIGETYKNGILQKTLYGTVQGLEVNELKTLLWKGIPYAKAPVGELRWKAPIKPDSWTGVYDATKNGNIGIQASGTKVLGNEDCLNLDIYRPNSNEANLPVLVYIHGGNNQSGTSQEINAQKLAVNANIIVISINYRLGLFGFNNLPALKTINKEESSGNYTLLDIAKSLDWVKENIGFFGGNSKNVTVSGFSAGGRDVMALLISPIFKGKFEKAISFSGGMTIADYNKSQKLFAKAIAPLVVEDKVKNNIEDATQWLMGTGEDVKNYLYKLSPERLAILMTNAGIRMEVFPHLFNDGVVLPKDGFETSKYNNVPLIMITGSSEFSLFGRFDKAFVGTDDKTLLSENDIAKNYSFIYKYGNRLYGLFNAQESAERMFKTYKAPIYTADFDWGTDSKIYGDRTAKIYGALHGIWLPFLTDETTGASALLGDSLENAGSKELTIKFTKYISNFLWNSNPNSKDLVDWKPWANAKKGSSQLILNADKEKAIITMSNDRVVYEDILSDMKNDNSISEENKGKMIKEVLNGRWFSKKLDETFKNENIWVQID